MYALFSALFTILFFVVRVFVACIIATFALAIIGFFVGLIWNNKLIILGIGFILWIIDHFLRNCGMQIPSIVYIIVISIAIIIAHNLE